MFVFRHPKYYTELRKRNNELQAATRDLAEAQSDQVISETTATANGERAPGPGLKQRDSQVVNQVKLSSQSQASGSKPQAPSSKRQASSAKQFQVPDASVKPQAQRVKRQATSVKLPDA